MWNRVLMGLVVMVLLCGNAQMVRAAESLPRHDRAERAPVRLRLDRAKAHTAGDSGMMLAFGVGLFGCASVCAVESHREERRRLTREAQPGFDTALPA